MAKTASVVVVGCGCPRRSMGHYHCHQMVYQASCPSATLHYVVEPWFMSAAGKHAPGSGIFDAWRKEMEIAGVLFFETVKEIPPVKEDERRLAIISARTCDNPRLFADCLSMGCHSIYLEKPGAPTVAELESMKNFAQAMGVSVLMGFNKNVSKYANKTIEFATSNGGDITFVHNNNYSPSELSECFERNSEGMLKNMAIHELALCVTFFGVSVDTIAQVVADRDFSSCLTLKGPLGNEFTDFDKLKFTITTKDGVKVSVAADRCGGDDSVGIVTDASGKETFRYSMPDHQDLVKMKELEEKDPGFMPYFYVQDADYATLKERIAKHCVDGTHAIGVATLDIAVETLKLAEFLTPLLQEQLR